MKQNCKHFWHWILKDFAWYIFDYISSQRAFTKGDPCHLHPQKLDFSDDLRAQNALYLRRQVWLSSISMVPCCTYKTYIVKNGTKLRNKILIFWLLRKLTNVVLSKSVGSASSSLMLSLSFVTLKDVRKNFSRLDHRRAF